jgi:hypothetical protein
MRGLLRLLMAASVVGALVALLRELLRRGPELLSSLGSEEPRIESEMSPGTVHKRRGQSRKELYEEAQRLEIEGRSKMNKSQLERAVGEAKEASR